MQQDSNNGFKNLASQENVDETSLVDKLRALKVTVINSKPLVINRDKM
jgi:hypothetical protein